MTTTTEQQYVFYRDNIGASRGAVPTRLTEREARTYIGASMIRVDRAIQRLKEGQIIRTRYGTYSARPV